MENKKALKLDHAAVLVVDMLNDFVTGALTCDRAKAIVPATAKLLEAARKAGKPVIFCNDAHLAGIDNENRLVGELNRYSNNMAEQMMRRWHELDNFLLVKYIDGNIKLHDDQGKFKTTETGVVAFPQQPPYPQWFYESIIQAKGEVLKVR